MRIAPVFLACREHDFRGMPRRANARILGRFRRAPSRASCPDHPGTSMKANRLAVALASLLLCSAPAFAAPPSSAGSSSQTIADKSEQSESLIQKLLFFNDTATT